AIESRREIFALGNVEPDAGFLNALTSASKLFLNRGLATEKGARDLAGAEAAEHLEREHDLRVGRDRRVTTDEHESERVVANLVLAFAREIGVGKGLVEIGNDRFLLGSGHALMAERVLGQVH